MAFLRLVVLIWADILASYVMWIMQTYLTDVWGLGFTHSAGIMNVANGLTKVLPVLFYYIVNVGLGHKWMLILSSLSYVNGLGFLFLSTPPVLGTATRTCTNYAADCIGDTQAALLYSGLALMAVGISGHVVSLVAVFADQFETNHPHEDKPIENNRDSQPELPSVAKLEFETVDAMLELVTRERKKVFRSHLIVLVPVSATFVLPYFGSWSIQFGIPAICTLVATLCFLLGFCECEYMEKRLEGCCTPVTSVFRAILAAILKKFQTVTSVFRVILATILKKFQTLLDSLGQKLHRDNSNNTIAVGHRFLGKAVIHMIPFSIPLIHCEVVSSMGGTYFVEQSNHMDYYVGEWNLSDSLLLISQWLGKLACTFMFKRISALIGKRYSPRFGIALATIFSTLCCLVAAVVETWRIQVIEYNGLVDEPESKIPLSVFILLPQYLLLVGLDTFYEKSVTDFLSDQSPPSMHKYLMFLKCGLSGLGHIGSILSVYVVGIFSELKGNDNWFQHDLNASRLDRYYWTLAVLSAANFIWFLLCARFYHCRERTSNDDDAERAENQAGEEEGITENVIEISEDTVEENPNRDRSSSNN